MFNVAQSPLIEDLFSVTSKPCLSLYLPTHRTQPERRDDQTRYRQLMRHLNDSLKMSFSSDEVTTLLMPFPQLERDDTFWNTRRQGVAIFRAPGVFITQHLDRSVPEIAVVAENFHVKPLFRLLQTLEDYHVLCLTRESAQLFVGNRDGLEEVLFPTGPLLLINEILGEELSDPGFSKRIPAVRIELFRIQPLRMKSTKTPSDSFARSIASSWISPRVQAGFRLLLRDCPSRHHSSTV